MKKLFPSIKLTKIFIDKKSIKCYIKLGYLRIMFISRLYFWFDFRVFSGFGLIFAEINTSDAIASSDKFH